MSAKSGTHSGNGGGRIIAQNAALLDMLRERTLELQKDSDRFENVEREPADDFEVDDRDQVIEAPISVDKTANHSSSRASLYSKQHSQASSVSGSSKNRRYFIASPPFTQADEDQYKFVNPDIDNESARSVSSRSQLNEPESVDAMPTVAELAKATSELAESNITTKPPSAKHHTSQPSMSGDNSTRHNEIPVAHDCSQHKSNFYNKVDPTQPKSDPFATLSKIAANRSGDSAEYETRPIEPVKLPLQPIPDEQTEELRLLEEEEVYQRQLQQRIQSAKQAGDRFHIPKLDLDEVSTVYGLICSCDMYYVYAKDLICIG